MTSHVVAREEATMGGEGRQPPRTTAVCTEGAGQV